MMVPTISLTVPLLTAVLSAQLSSTTAFVISAAKPATTRLYSSTLDDSQRVVVTGLGVVSGCGVTVPEFFESCCEGKSSIRKVQRFDIQHYPCQIASEVPAEMFDANTYFTNPKNARSNDRYTHFAVAASRMALQDSGLGDTPETLHNPDRIGVMVGSAFGGMETFEQETLKLASKPERPKVGICGEAGSPSRPAE
jgi:3-oxoacyl-(acyl-carrier-protein) synthase